MIKYSVIVPVYNRPVEAEELLLSLAKQTYKNFEVIIVEDGSQEKCQEVANSFGEQLNIQYHYKKNSGPGDSRNVGMSLAKGEYLVFFDSDCLIPAHYFEEVEKYLSHNKVDAFGGPDAADASFSITQKAINYAMTSVITTGGVRGKQNKLDTYQPRSFNMGLSRQVYETTGGFGDIHPGEDPDLSYRIMNAGFKIGLIEKAYVYHKRRISFKKFALQVYKFGVVRPILIKWYPDKFKITYAFPTAFLLFVLSSVLASLFMPLLGLPLALLTLIIFLNALIVTRSLPIAILGVFASYIQLCCYGYGFLKSASLLFLAKKDERKAFPGFFFSE